MLGPKIAPFEKTQRGYPLLSMPNAPLPGSGPGTLPPQVNILGCGGHARSVADILLSLDPRVGLVFYDAQAKPEETLMGFPVLPLPTDRKGAWFPAVGDGMVRRRWMETHPQVHWLTIIAPTAHIGQAARIGEGVFIAAGAHVGPEAVVEKGGILNTGAVLEHESTLGEYAHAAPHSTICGRARLGRHAFLGAGSVIIDKVEVADGVVIGAGATVVNSLTVPGVYGGTPAKLLKP